MLKVRNATPSPDGMTAAARVELPLDPSAGSRQEQDPIVGPFRFFWATHSRLEPVIDVAYMIKRHLYGVLNYFSAARITNAAAEGLNSKIQTIKKMAYGFRNREHFKTAIFFHCGGLQLHPATHGEAR